MVWDGDDEREFTDKVVIIGGGEEPDGSTNVGLVSVAAIMELDGPFCTEYSIEDVDKRKGDGYEAVALVSKLKIVAVEPGRLDEELPGGLVCMGDEELSGGLVCMGDEELSGGLVCMGDEELSGGLACMGDEELPGVLVCMGDEEIPGVLVCMDDAKSVIATVGDKKAGVEIKLLALNSSVGYATSDEVSELSHESTELFDELLLALCPSAEDSAAMTIQRCATRCGDIVILLK